MFKKPSFAKTAVSSLKMSELEIFLWLTQALPQILQCKYLEIKEQQRRLLERVVDHKGFFKLFGKKAMLGSEY